MELYRTLGIPHTADAATIRNAYRALAKRHHPDVDRMPGAHDRFVAIAEAYQVLSDPATRTRYDRTWQRAAERRNAQPRPAQRPQATPSKPRYDRAYRAYRRNARAQAETHSRMDHADFDAHMFDTVAAHVAPKMLGCVGIGVVAMLAVIVLVALASTFEVLAIPVALIVFFGFLPGVAYASTLFDMWHDKRQVRRKKGR